MQKKSDLFTCHTAYLLRGNHEIKPEETLDSNLKLTSAVMTSL